MADAHHCARDESLPLIDGHPPKEPPPEDESLVAKKIFKRKPTGKPITVRTDLKKARIRFSSTDTQLFSDGHKSVNQWQSYSHLGDNSDHELSQPNHNSNGSKGSKPRSVHSDSDLSICLAKEDNEENGISEELNEQNQV